jgi:E3 ubiquitin-protein ligase mind-bomb
MSGGKTCLQVAAHQGHQQLVEYLLSIGANVNIVDKEGDSVLHYAAFGNQPDIMRTLLQHGAKINVLNASHCTALHISAHKKPPHCVRVLLEFNADVNLQDSYGDTALHDAIGKENTEVIELLCNVPSLDLTIRNKRGFNCLHHASLKGNVTAARRILQLARQLIDVKKDDGFSALHLAALNGHHQVCEVLVKEGQADIDIRNDRRQTPFLLAVSQGHSAAIEKLVDLKCDILAKDEDGDNAMHLSIIKKANLSQEVPQLEAPKIYEIFQQLSHIQEHRLMYTLLCFLAQEGCKMEANYKGARIFDWIPEQENRELIYSYERKFNASGNAIASGSNDCNQTREITELRNNIENMNLTSQDSTTLSMEIDNSGGSSSMANFNAPSSSNPPTPARRNRANNNTTRDAPTPPPPSVVSVEDDKKLNTDLRAILRNHTTSPPLLPQTSSNEPTTSAGIDSISPNRNNSQSPPLATSSKHISRKQQIVPRLIPPPFKPQPQTPQECIVCNELMHLITFEPCYHQICCEDCGLRMKKCLQCHAMIDKRLTNSGKLLLPKETGRQPSADRLRYLETKIQEIEENHCCSICMERKRNVAFLCGHSACSKCAETLKTCHM